MLELKLSAVTATLEHLNTRTEKIGPDDVPASTLKITCPVPASMLAFFSPTLEEHLFDKEGSKDLLGDGARVRYPHLDYPLALDHEMTGAKTRIDYGLGTMELADCVVNEFRITPWEGGTVVLGFKVNCKPDAEKDIPKLYVLQKKGITFTLEPAEIAELKDAA